MNEKMDVNQIKDFLALANNVLGGNQNAPKTESEQTDYVPYILGGIGLIVLFSALVLVMKAAKK